MVYQEVFFEKFAAAREVTRGTPVTPPTVLFPWKGIITPQKTVARRNAAAGDLEEFESSEVVHRVAQFETESAPLDVRRLPFVLNGLIKGGVTPSTPGTLSRLWAYVPATTADDLKAFTGYWGDPNIGVNKHAFAMFDSLDVEWNTDSDDFVMMSTAGTAQWDGAVMLTGGGIPAFPAAALGGLLVPQKAQLWIDTSSAIGTSAITSRLVSGKISIPSGIEYKYPAMGPAGGLTFDHLGRNVRHAEMTLVLEVPDLTQYNNWRAHDVCKVRVRLNGSLIENVAAVDYYNYFEFDIYGPLDGFSWGDLKGTNRTIEVMITSERDVTLGSSFRAAVENIYATEVA